MNEFFLCGDHLADPSGKRDRKFHAVLRRVSGIVPCQTGGADVKILARIRKIDPGILLRLGITDLRDAPRLDVRFADGPVEFLVCRKEFEHDVGIRLDPDRIGDAA